MNKRRNFNAKFKTKVVLEALSERETMSEIAQRHGLHLSQVSKWKQDFLSAASTVFEAEKSKKKTAEKKKEDKLYKIIGQQKVEIDFLKNALS